ncbi:MAG: hypothetical protein JWN56_830 [Sphingobacteriales bacterium]|nr:hypothetical protein [Sphingobacteriales bacterium]
MQLRKKGYTLLLYRFFIAVGFGSLLWLGSCAPKVTAIRSGVSERIKQQYGYDLSAASKPGTSLLPPSVQLNNGIAEDEAVSLALYNNPQYQSDLATIAISQADVTDAGVVSNPLLRYLLPSGGLNVSGYINFGLDFLWQRPQRIAFAKAELERTSENMVQRGYTLIRDVQTAFADLQLVKEKAAILAQNATIRKEIQELANTRFRLGDISELETLTTRADSAAAVDEYTKASLDTILTIHRLNTLLGYSPDTVVNYVFSKTDFINHKVSKDEYFKLAFENQPELKSATLSINSGGKKLGWERSRIINFMGTLNFQHINGKGGSELLPNAFNPGIQMELPVLNRNQGKIARARAEMEQASFNYVSIRQRVVLDVANAYDRYEQTLKSYQVWNTNTLPALQEAVRLSRLTYQRGDISYLPVLEAMRQLMNGQLRKAEIEAELRRAVSQLNLSIGKKTQIN